MHNGCEKLSIRQEVLENLVLDALQNKLTREKTMTAMIKRLMETQNKMASEAPILNMLKQDLKNTEKALDNLVAALENGISSPTTNKRLSELEARKEELACKIQIEQSKTAILLTEREIREYYLYALQKEPQMLINELVKIITLYDDRMHIELNKPIMKGPDESQGFSFYTEIVKVPSYNISTGKMIKGYMTIKLSV